eukprot:SAG22_NODE_2214_length_2828_cov_2.586295_3_plen_305_part_00
MIHGRSSMLPDAETGRAEAPSRNKKAAAAAAADGSGKGGEVAPPGSTTNPFLYTGKKMQACGKCAVCLRKQGGDAAAGACERAEHNVGTQMDANHSHYVLVDDGSNGCFGREINFRSELEDFISFRRDEYAGKVDDLTEEIRKQTSESQRSVPVITMVRCKALSSLVLPLEFCLSPRLSSPSVCLPFQVYGGGPGTVQTMVEALESGNPIIVVRNSGRAADMMVRQRGVMLLKAVITAFPSVSLPFLAVPLRSQPTVAIRSTGRRWLARSRRPRPTGWSSCRRRPRPRRCVARHCLPSCAVLPL